MPKYRVLKESSGVQVRQDPMTGLVWAIDRGGKMRSCHPFRRASRGPGSVPTGLGWNPGDRIIRCSGFMFNAEIYQAGIRIESELGELCGCVGCLFRRDQARRLSSIRRLLVAVAALHREDLLDRHKGTFNRVGWDAGCQVCSRAIKVAERHSLSLPDPNDIAKEED